MSYPVGTRVFISRQSPVLAGCIATIVRVLPETPPQYLCRTHSGRDARVLHTWIGMGAAVEEVAELLYVPEAAQHLGCTTGAIIGAIRSGHLEATRDGRFYRVKVSDLDRWNEKRVKRESVAAGRGRA